MENTFDYIRNSQDLNKLPFFGFNDSEWFSNDEDYYLVEIEKDSSNVKIIDSGIKERLEEKAKKYNELVKIDKAIYNRIITDLWNQYSTNLRNLYYKGIDTSELAITYLKQINNEIFPFVTEYLKLINGSLVKLPFKEYFYKVKTIEKGFYDNDKEIENNSRLEN